MESNIIDKIICADAVDGLKMIPDNLVHLTWTSPPYGILDKNAYTDRDDQQPFPEYLNWLKDVFTEVYRTTVSGGRVVINIDAVINRQEDKDQEYVRAIYPNLYFAMKEIGWKFYTEICWFKHQSVGSRITNWGSYCSPSCFSLRRNHEYILIFSKDKFKLDGDTEPDITPDEFKKWTFSTWNVQPETRKLGGHPCPFSEILSYRVIKLCSFPGQIILDPFVGTGTTCVVASMLGRKYIGIDNSKKYCEYARNRIEKREDIFPQFNSEDNKKTRREKEKEEKERQQEDNCFKE